MALSGIQSRVGAPARSWIMAMVEEGMIVVRVARGIALPPRPTISWLRSMHATNFCANRPKCGRISHRSHHSSHDDQCGSLVTWRDREDVLREGISKFPPSKH